LDFLRGESSLDKKVSRSKTTIGSLQAITENVALAPVSDSVSKLFSISSCETELEYENKTL